MLGLVGHPYVLGFSFLFTLFIWFFSMVTSNRWHDRFDTVKVRLQTSKDGHFRGPVDCVLQTVRKEGVAGLYKGATPPLVGWMAMDSV